MTGLKVAIPLLLLLAACRGQDKSEGPVARAQFGVLYGGEIQQRDQIPFELDRRKMTLLLRIDFDPPLATPARVTWSIDKPGTAKGVRDVEGRRGVGRLVKVDEARLAPGRARFDQTVDLVPGDPLGTWKIRVTVDGKTVLERSIVVYDPALGAAGVPDAGRSGW